MSSNYTDYQKGSRELRDKLIEDHHSWATAIAKSVARSWSLDWQLDGLDGGAYEALIFCADRYDPQMGVPFKGYARRRIHEASTEEARKSKNWKIAVGGSTPEEDLAKDISLKLYSLFPELRDGLLPKSQVKKGESSDIRSSIRKLIASASILATTESVDKTRPDMLAENKLLISHLVDLNEVHQHIIWEVYWEGLSMRALAKEWGVDELVIIREHSALLEFVNKVIQKKQRKDKLKIRPGLKKIAKKIEAQGSPPFQKLVRGELFLIFLGIFFWGYSSGLIL